jgi:hypothetical protein
MEESSIDPELEDILSAPINAKPDVPSKKRPKFTPIW